MSYSEKISKLEIELVELRQKRVNLANKMSTLKVGDIVYVAGGNGGFDVEYFPQEILEFDIPNTTLTVLEKSINRKSKLDAFFLKEDGEFKYYN